MSDGRRLTPGEGRDDQQPNGPLERLVERDGHLVHQDRNAFGRQARGAHSVPNPRAGRQVKGMGFPTAGPGDLDLHDEASQ